MKFLTIIALLLSVSLCAFTPQKVLKDRFSVGAEWIYFSPNSESQPFAINENVQTRFQRAGLIDLDSNQIFDVSDPILVNRFDDFYSGYRVYGSYGFCNCNAFVAVSWTDLQANHSASGSGNDITFLNVGGHGTVTDKRKFRYSAVEGIIGQRFCTNCCNDLIGFLGIHYARLHSDHKEFFQLAPNHVGHNSAGSFRNHFWGVGPEVGASLEALLWCGFSLQGTATAAFIIGQPDDDSSITQFPGNIQTGFITNYTSPDVWRVVPYGDIRLAVNYGFSFWCLNFDIDAGYEALVYYRALPNFFELGFDSNDLRNVTMHGPFVGLTINF